MRAGKNLELGSTSGDKSASTPVVCIIGIASLYLVAEEGEGPRKKGGDQGGPFVILEILKK